MTYLYDTKSGRLSTALNIAAYWYTVVPKVLASLEFWLFFLLHLVTWFAFKTGFFSGETGPNSNHELDLAWTDVKVITAITTFFEVFYSNQCYARYLRFHNYTRGMISDAHAFAFVLRTHIGEKCRNHLRLSVRYMVAGVLLHFYDIKHKGEERDLLYLQRLGVLRPGDVQALIKMQPEHRSMITLNWSSNVACMGMKKADAPPPVQSASSARLLKIHAHQQEILDGLGLPVPFAYYHLLSVMVLVNLAMWAYRMALTESWFAPFVYFFASVIFIGVMELSSELSDPFGTDEVDFPLDRWVGEMVELLVEMTEYDYECGNVGGQAGFELACQQEVPMKSGIQDFKILTDDDRHHLVGDSPLPLDQVKPQTITSMQAPNSSRSSATSYMALNPISPMLEERNGTDMHLVQSMDGGPPRSPERREDCTGKMRRCMQ